MVYSITEQTISGVSLLRQCNSADKTVRRGVITDHHLIAFYLSNISAENL